MPAGDRSTDSRITLGFAGCLKQSRVAVSRLELPRSTRARVRVRGRYRRDQSRILLSRPRQQRTRHPSLRAGAEPRSRKRPPRSSSEGPTLGTWRGVPLTSLSLEAPRARRAPSSARNQAGLPSKLSRMNQRANPRRTPIMELGSRYPSSAPSVTLRWRMTPAPIPAWKRRCWSPPKTTQGPASPSM